MYRITLRAQAFVLLTLFAATSVALAASPSPSSHATLPARPVSPYPKEKLHTEFVVEVNKKGQIYRVRSGKSCPDTVFNAQTYGNVLQMWIRHPDGTAEVGLYRVTYDYDPNTHKIKRGVALLKPGGDWGDKEGAANEMMDIVRSEARAAHATPTPTLPPLKQVLGTPTPKP